MAPFKCPDQVLRSLLEGGDRKTAPTVPTDALHKMASIVPKASAKPGEILGPMMATELANLEYPSVAS